MALKKIKGQNFRAFVGTGTATAVRSATSCSVAINGNMEDSTTKDSENSFTQEQMTSKSWSVNVDSVNASVTTLRRLLGRIKDGEPLKVGFDHTNGDMNRTAAGADFARVGMALLTDLTIQADNHTTVSISEQYTGTGPLSKAESEDFSNLDGMMGEEDKGQHIRLFISKSGTKKAIALATSLSFHVGASVEDSTTKDSTDGKEIWQENEVTGLSYDAQIGAMIGVGTDDANTLADMIDGVNDVPVDWELAVTSGEQNRQIHSIIATGQGKLSNVSPSGSNRQNASYTATLTGYGAYKVHTEE